MTTKVEPTVDKWVEKILKEFPEYTFAGMDDIDKHNATPWLTEIVKNIQSQSLQEAKAESRKDKERLDFLDRCNKVLNDHYGTDYGWELILNHNITRLMSGHLDRIDLNDAHGGDTRYKSCREAIDKALSTLNTKDSLKQEEEA